jgi:membrane-associated phospholipid phosphatase
MDHPHKTFLSKDSKIKLRESLAAHWVHNHHLSRSLVIAANLLIFVAILPPFVRTALWHGLIAHRYLTGMLLLFNLLALSLLWSTGQFVDAWVFIYFNYRGERPLWLDRVMLGITQLGNGVVGMLIAVILFLTDDHHLAYELILGTLTLWLTVELIKALIHRPRPFIKLFQTRIVGSRAKGRSFPSGHTSQSFFTVTLLIQHFHFGFWIAFLLYALAIWVGITRMYVGAHYPRDVLAGAILGSVWGVLGIMVDMHFFMGI